MTSMTINQLSEYCMSWMVFIGFAWPNLSTFLDPLQFAYRLQVGVDNATCCSILIHIWTEQEALWGLCVLILKCLQHDPAPVAEWEVLWVAGRHLHNLLKDRVQSLQQLTCMSEAVMSSTRVRQGAILTPLMFALTFSTTPSPVICRNFLNDLSSRVYSGGQKFEYIYFYWRLKVHSCPWKQHWIILPHLVAVLEILIVSGDGVGQLLRNCRCLWWPKDWGSNLDKKSDSVSVPFCLVNNLSFSPSFVS